MGSIGATVRRAFGPYERQVSELYRRIFIDLDDLTARIAAWTDPQNILEIGCGEGALAERLVHVYPRAAYLGIDLIGHLGRQYAGPPGRAEFRQVDAKDLALERPGAFDLVVINDVMHHVPGAARNGVFEAARALLAPKGHLVFKDWDRRATPIHLACYMADVYIGGDKNVRYMPLAEQRALIAETFGDEAIIDEASIRPWKHNHAFLIRAS